MSVAEMLRDLRAAQAARARYQESADRLAAMAAELWRDGWTGWARECARMADIAQRAARGER